MTRFAPRSIEPLPMTATPPSARPPGDHIHFPEVAWPEPSTVSLLNLAGAGGVLPGYVPSRIHAGHAGGHFGGYRYTYGAELALRVDATAALASLAEAEALAAAVPTRPALLRRLLPSTATVFWMAVSVWLGFLLARAEGWL